MSHVVSHSTQDTGRRHDIMLSTGPYRAVSHVPRSARQCKLLLTLDQDQTRVLRDIVGLLDSFAINEMTFEVT